MLTQQQYTTYVKNYINTVFRLALSYTKNPTDAEDIMQTVFLKLLQQKKEFTSDEHIRAWLIRVTVNECKKWYRSPWRRHQSYEDYEAFLPDTGQRNREILRAVMALPDKCRTVIYLHYYEGYTTQEIADLTRMPKGTVCYELSRGRELLKLEMMGEDIYA